VTVDFIRRFRYWLRRSRREAELREEMETHRLLRQAQLEREGLASEDAARASKLRFGPPSIARDDVADVWTASLDGWRQDARHAVKSVTTRRGFAITAVVTLALCVGANLVVFTIVNALWLRPRAVVEPDRVVMVSGANDLSGTSEGSYFGELGLDRYLRSQPAFEVVAGQVPTSGEMADNRLHIRLSGMTDEAETIAVSWQYFSVMGLRILGRDFTSDDDAIGAAPVAIVSDRLWRRRFGGSRDVIGAEIDASPVKLRIVGIAPAGFHGARLGERADLWIPRRLVSRVATPGMAQRDPSLLALARLRPGISYAEAEQAVTTASGMPADSPYYVQYRVVPVDRLYGSPDSRTILIQQHGVVWTAAAMAALVLLAGCATLMAVVLVHYERRRQEIAIRLALGSSRPRLIRALACELALLAVFGIVAAVSVSSAALQALPVLSLPGGLDLGRLDLGVDPIVAGVGLVAAAVTLIVAAVVPLRRSTRPALASELASASSRTTASSHRLRSAILSLHVAATMVVLVGAGLFVQTVVHGFTEAPGFDSERLVFAEVKTRATWGTAMTRAQEAARTAAQAERITRMLDAIARHPGIESVALGDAPIGLDQAAATRVRTYVTAGQTRDIRSTVLNAAPGYTRALALRRLAGRDLTDADVNPEYRITGETPVLVTRAFAETMWPGDIPLGRRFGPRGVDGGFVVAGVVSDLALGSQRLGNRNGMLIPVNPLKVARRFTVDFVARTAGDPAELIEPIRRAVLEEFPNAPTVNVRTAREAIADDLGRERLGAWFFSGFGLVALALGVGGVFGLVAYLAESRRRELGVRLALGAQHGQIARLLIGAGVRPVAIGTTVGIVAAALIVQLVESTVYGIRDVDASAFVVAATLMLGGTALAGLAAAWRARRIAPSEALRAE
jgi:predicted permease